MKITSVGLTNFRRFREPFALAGFTDGLNIVVEPNEQGKSTILEALRAALFVRHSTNSELTRSYCPVGDAVAPMVEVEFDVRGERWKVEKRFLRSPRVQLSGPAGRLESDAAEERLQSLLGFERNTKRDHDYDVAGPLGMLWVEQASALRVDAPGRLVQDRVRSALESEVGAVTGGRRLDAVRERVDQAYGELRTGKSGKSTGRLLATEQRLDAARLGVNTAAATLKIHDATLTELEQARKSLKLVQRELDDEEQLKLREQLASNLKLAESAADRLSTAEARHQVAAAEVRRLTDRVEGITAAETALELAEGTHRLAVSATDEHKTERDAAIDGEAECQRVLREARAARMAADQVVSDARVALTRYEQAAALARARQRFIELEQLEAELATSETTAKSLLATKVLDDLRSLDRAVIEAGAVLIAGAVRLEIEVHDGTSISLDGGVVRAGTHEITRPTAIAVGDHASIRIIPPGAGSAAAQLQAAEAKLGAALKGQGVESYADAIARNDVARGAGEGAKAVARQIATLCVADPVLKLEAGPAALRALLATAKPDVTSDETPADVSEAVVALARTAENERVADGRHEAALKRLRNAEGVSLTQSSALAGAERDLQNAQDQLRRLVEATSKDELVADLALARQELARRAADKDTADQAARGFDAVQLQRRIDNMDKARTGAAERRLDLMQKIAGLEATVAGEGAKGLASQVAEAEEEEVAATEACERLRTEADTLELLRTTLQEAQEAAARTFLGPVTRRVIDYANRVLPGCELQFSDAFGLTSVTRAGVCEDCGTLSRGTQEQLAVLTRLAFADLLRDRGAPVSLILDDPLVYSDDARLDTMTEILASAAERMQVILLTCRERAFRHLEGNRVTIPV